MAAHKGDNLRVLVVEDERRLRALLEEIVPELGFSVSAVPSAEAAIAIMETEPHDILLLDLQLPGMSGMELLDVVRTRWPETQAVILTAFGDLEMARRAIHLDVVEFLCKPFHLRDIELAFDRARQRIVRASQFTAPSRLPPEPGEPSTTLADAEYRHILAALQRNVGNRTAAAADLGISRRTLHYRLAEYRERGWRVDK